MRAVLDTNILISACWTPDGLEARTVRLAIEQRFTVCVSEAIWAEYEEVFRRPKFALLRGESQIMLETLRRVAFAVSAPGAALGVFDEDDQCFLECAEAGDAEYLITGNLKHFPPQWGATHVVNARQFLSAAGFLCA